MKSWLLKMSMYAILGGLVLAGYSAYQMYLKRNVSNEVTEVAIADVATLPQDYLYANITGGQPDLENTYQITLQSKKSQKDISTYYFMPVIDAASGKLVYILKSEEAPDVTSVASGSLVQKGLLEPGSEIDDKLKSALQGTYSDLENSFVLDSSYTVAKSGQELKMAGIGLVLFVIGLVIRTLLSRSNKSSAQLANQNA